jgi:hypothetical protein
MAEVHGPAYPDCVRLRQVALVARELEPVVQDLCAVLGIEIAFRDPAVKLFGLCNAVMPLGDTFLEVVSPIAADASAARFLERRGGDGGYMVIVQSDDPEADRKRVARAGVRIVWEHVLPDIDTIHLHPRDVGGAILSLDVARPPGSWRWAGPDWERRVRTEVSTAIAGVTLQAEDPEALAQRWSRVLDRPARTERDVHEIHLEPGTIRFVPPGDGRGPGLCALDVVAVDAGRALAAARARGLEVRHDEVQICGTRFRLR